MGCVSDAVLFGSLRRLRVWALAMAVALVGSQALDAAGLVDLGRSVYRQQGWLWAGTLPGGLLFGFGMVQAGGCVSRNLTRLGAGSLKAGAALLAVAAAAAATALIVPDRRRTGRATADLGHAAGARDRRGPAGVLPAPRGLSPLARRISPPGWSWAP